MAESNTERLKIARALVAALEADDATAANTYTHQLAGGRDRALFDEIGQLTRGLHTKITAFADDDRVMRLTTEDIPDARKRLEWVIEKTSNSAHQTLEMIDQSLPLAGEVVTVLEQFAKEHPDVDVRTVLALARAADETLQDNLTTALMAQDYQDLTGQIIHRVIDLVGEVELRLARLLRISGEHLMPEAAPAPPSAPSTVTQPVVGSTLEGPRVAGVSSSSAVDSQDDVDALLSAFGF